MDKFILIDYRIIGPMDLYFKKDIIYSFEGKTFEFGVTESLFSTFDIDHGTDFYLEVSHTIIPKLFSI